MNGREKADMAVHPPRGESPRFGSEKADARSGKLLASRSARRDGRCSWLRLAQFHVEQLGRFSAESLQFLVLGCVFLCPLGGPVVPPVGLGWFTELPVGHRP